MNTFPLVDEIEDPAMHFLPWNESDLAVRETVGISGNNWSAASVTLDPVTSQQNVTNTSLLTELTSVVEYMDQYFIPTVIALGLLGNTISFVVFVVTYLNRLSLSVYLAGLAVSDSGFLLALAIGWLEYAGLPLFHTNGWCQMVVYVSYVCSFLSAWFVVSFTVERYIAICHPLRRPDMCTVRRARIVVLSLSAVGLSLYACSLWTSGVESYDEFDVCTPLKDYYEVHLGLTYADLVLTWIIPFASILGLNFKIFHKIAYFYNRNEQLSVTVMLSRHSHGASPYPNNARLCSLGNRAQVKVTKMLLTISTVFLVINLPSYVMRLRLFVISFTDNTYHSSRMEVLIQQLLQFLFYINFSINFLVYAVCSKKFREALYRLGWQMKYKVGNFVRQSYRLIRGSSSPDSLVHELGPRPIVDEYNFGIKAP